MDEGKKAEFAWKVKTEDEEEYDPENGKISVKINSQINSQINQGGLLIIDAFI